MKKLILSLIVFGSYLCSAQTMVKSVITVPISPTQTEFADQFTPSDLIAGKLYPTIIFMHGAGEVGSTAASLSVIENSKGSGGPIYWIVNGGWPTVFTNPVTGAKEEFIVIAPQANDWNISGDALANVVNFLVASNPSIDVNRIHLTGLSAGGMSVVEYVAQLDPAEDMPSVSTNVRKWKAATCIPMSQATNDPGTSGTWGTVTAATNTSIWGFGDLADVHGDATFDYVNLVIKAKASLGKWTSFSTGHGPWDPFYNPAGAFGIYTWMLGIKRTDQVQPVGGTTPPPVVIPPVPVTPPVTPPVSSGSPGINVLSKTSYLLIPNSGYLFLKSADFKAAGVMAGDTLWMKNSDNWHGLAMDSLINTDTLHPVVIKNLGPRVNISMVDVTSSSNCIGLTNSIGIKIDGLSSSGYGFFAERDPHILWQGGIGVEISGQSRNIEAQGVKIHSMDRGFDVKNEGDCGGPGSGNLGSWTISSIKIHDDSVVWIWNEGAYLGNTSPDNAKTSSDPRPVPCGGVTIYPRPGRLSNIWVYNCYFDSTGRGGIQLSSASGAISMIFNNSVNHAGLNGDDGQGVAISTGEYTNAYVAWNKINDTYTWGIAAVGTGSTLIIEHNTILNAGGLSTFDNSQTSAASYDPKTAKVYPDTLKWVQAIAILDRPHQDPVTTWFAVNFNTIGSYKSPTMAITLENTGTFANGDSAVGNVLTSGSPAIVSSVNSAVAFSFIGGSGGVTPPPVNIPPTVSAGPNQAITIPPASIPLVGTASPNGTAKSLTYSWAKVSGPGLTTITNSTSASAVASGLQAGVYVFQLTVTDNNGLSASAQVTITVQAAPVVCPTCPTCPPVVNCPPAVVCPVCPAPRTVVSISIVSGSVIITFSDGKTQKL
jgi:hypothetical protein